MLDENRVKALIDDIDIVLGYGGAWDAHRFLRQLLEQLKQVLKENNDA